MPTEPLQRAAKPADPRQHRETLKAKASQPQRQSKTSAKDPVRTRSAEKSDEKVFSDWAMI